MGDATQPWLDRVDSWPYRLCLVGLPALSALAEALHGRFLAPMEPYLVDAETLTRHGHITEHFLPFGYPLLLAIGTGLAPSHPGAGIVALQAVLQVLIALLLWAILRELRFSARLAFVSALLLSIHPQLLLNIPQILDVSVSVFFLLAVFFCALKMQRRERMSGYTVACGLLLGLGTAIRPNYALLLPALFLASYRSRLQGTVARRVGNAALQTAVAAVLAVATFYAGALIAYGHFDSPHNGPYNLYAGQNAYSKDMLLAHLNGEESIRLGLKAEMGLDLDQDAIQDDSLAPAYMRLSKQFALHHPAQEAELVVVKLWTMLRPNSRQHSTHGLDGAEQVVLALPVPIWLCLCVYGFGVRRLRLGAADWLMLTFMFCYVLPFLMTNSTSRYRVSLDVLALIQTLDVWRRLRFGATAVS